jgi:hypothetical protein
MFLLNEVDAGILPSFWNRETVESWAFRRLTAS